MLNELYQNSHVLFTASLLSTLPANNHLLFCCPPFTKAIPPKPTTTCLPFLLPALHPTTQFHIATVAAVAERYSVRLPLKQPGFDPQDALRICLACFGRHAKPLVPMLSSPDDLKSPNFASNVKPFFNLGLINSQRILRQFVSVTAVRILPIRRSSGYGTMHPTQPGAALSRMLV